LKNSGVQKTSFLHYPCLYAMRCTSYNSLYKIGISALRMNHFPAGDKISGTGLLTADSESYTLTNHTNGQKFIIY